MNNVKEEKIDLVAMPEILNKSDSTEDLGSEGHSNRASTNPSPTLDNVLTKHPLQNQWTLWYYKIDRTKDWEDNQRMVSSFFLTSNSNIQITKKRFTS